MDQFNACPVLSCAQALEWEKTILGGSEDKEWVAIQRVGAVLSSRLLDLYDESADFPDVFHLLILAGKGHNTADALMTLVTLRDAGFDLDVDIVWACDREGLKPLVSRSLECLSERLPENDSIRQYGVSQAELDLLSKKSYDICLDGLLGLQFRPPLSDVYQTLVDWANGHPSIFLRVAVDLPSGLTESSPMQAFRADVTMAPGILKSPLLASSCADYVGRIEFLDVGFFNEGKPAEYVSQVLDRRCLGRIRRIKPASAHKYSSGHVLLVGGSTTMPGSILMAAKGAVGSGAGLVTVFVPRGMERYLAPQLPEALWVPLPVNPRDGRLNPAESAALIAQYAKKADVLVAGPGLSNSSVTDVLVGRLIQLIDLPLVLDAGALQESILKDIRGRDPGYGSVLLTPHLGELRRVFGNPSLTQDDFESFERYCKNYRLHLLVKGSRTHFCSSDTIYHYVHGSPLLARGGSGDILSGMIGSLMAQGHKADLDAAALAAVWLGEASRFLARERGQLALKTTDVLSALGPVLKSLPGRG